MYIVMRIVGSFVLLCQFAAASGRDRSRAPRVVQPSLFGGKKSTISFIPFPSIHLGTAAQRRLGVRSARKFLSMERVTSMSQSDVQSRGRSGAEIKTRRADRGTENIPIAPCKNSQPYGLLKRYHYTNKTATFKQSVYC